MAAKRKKNDEIWLTTKQSLNTNFKDEFELNVEKFIELKQNLERLEEEKDKNLKKIKQLEQTLQKADISCANHLKQLDELKNLVNDLEIKLGKKSEQYDQAIKQLEDEKNYFNKQEEKWQVFQKDLLTTVRVANDLKTEAEEQSETLLNENKTLSEKITNLENELSKLRVNNGAIYDCKSDLVDIKNLKDESDDKIVFRKRLDERQVGGKRNANCFTDLNNSLNKYEQTNGHQPKVDSIVSPTSSKLFRQQSADSVFSSVRQQDKLKNLRNSTQSLKSVASLDQSKLNKISVKTLVKTIENKTNYQTGSQTNSQTIVLSKSPSFNSINLNEKASIKSAPSFNAQFFSSNSNDSQSTNGISNGGTDKCRQSNEHQTNGKLTPKANETNNLRKLESIDDKFVTNDDKSSTTKLTDKLNKLDKLDKLELIKSRLNSKKNLHTLNNKELNNHLIEDKNDLNKLIKDGGSKRNKLLKWCQKQTSNYDNIEISNFSSSWTDSLSFCALLHSLDPALIPSFHSLDKNNKRHNFTLAFNAAKSIGIQPTLNIEELINEERPDWSSIMAYVSSIYNHFESKSH